MFQYKFIVILVLIALILCTNKRDKDAAVIINDYEIFRPEILQTAEMLRESMISAYPEKAVEGITNELLSGAAQQLIANRLLIEEAKKNNITADPSLIDSGYNTILNRFADKESFQNELVKMGETESSFKKRIAEGICLDSLMRRILDRNKSIDSQMCKVFYDENKDRYIEAARIHVGQIFIPFNDTMNDTIRKHLVKKAHSVHKKLKSGKGFELCAKTYSYGPGAESGGDIGWFKKGDLRKILEDALQSCEKGEITDVITSDIGLHILKKIDEEAQRQLSFEEVEKRIRLLLEIKMRNQIVTRLIDSLVQIADIRYIDTTLIPKTSATGIQKTLGLTPAIP